MDTADERLPQPHARPLSPHLQIYRFQLTSVLSVLHRATGLALSAGMGALVVWLVALAVGGAVWEIVSVCVNSWLGRVALMGWTWSLFFHLSTGIRHLVWDTGRGLDLPSVYRSGYLAVAVSALMTLGVWIYAFAAQG